MEITFEASEMEISPITGNKIHIKATVTLTQLQELITENMDNKLQKFLIE